MKTILIALLSGLLIACSPVKTALTNEYKLAAFSSKQRAVRPSPVSILVNPIDAAAGYQTAQMLYTKKPFEIAPFAHNGWIDPPAEMLFPLVVQSLSRSHFFYAVASSSASEKTTYRLDVQLIELQQNFLKKPSRIHLVAKALITHVPNNQVIASRLFTLDVPCPSDNPYGGVVAANKATLLFTDQLTGFVIGQIRGAEG